MIFWTAAYCLALNVYWEAQNQPILGQLAVAQVVLNRVEHPAFPNDICAVVTEDRGPKPWDCQFSWWCDGKSDRPTDEHAWIVAQAVAEIAQRGAMIPALRRAKWYHATYVDPGWGYTAVAWIGDHIFYEE